MFLSLARPALVFKYLQIFFALSVLGKGANVILDCVGSSFWEQNIKSLAVEGRWIVYGLLGGGNVSGNLLGNVLRKRVSLIGTTLKSRSLAVWCFFFLWWLWKTQFSSRLSFSLKASPDGPNFIRINLWATILWATIWHTGTNYIPQSI